MKDWSSDRRREWWLRKWWCTFIYSFIHWFNGLRDWLPFVYHFRLFNLDVMWWTVTKWLEVDGGGQGVDGKYYWWDRHTAGRRTVNVCFRARWAGIRSHHLSLPQPFTPDFKLTSFHNPFFHSHIVTLIPSGLLSRILTCSLYWIKGAQPAVCLF